MSWENFTLDEFACKCGGCEGENKISHELVDELQRLRTTLAFAMPVTSGYRCPNHPIELAKSKPGTHTEGLAADIGVSHEQAFILLRWVYRQGRILGIGVSQKGSGRFIHLDIAPPAPGRPRPHLYSY